MEKVVLLSGCAAALLLAGCSPELAKGAYGAEEEQWQKVISSSYSGYRPPRTAPPAIVDKATPEALEKQRERQEQSGAAAAEKDFKEEPAAADDPAKTVDDAAVKAEPLPPKEEKKEAAPADKKADKKAVKADEKAVKTDKKADKAQASAEKQADTGDYTLYVVKAGDTPGSIAQKFYGKASFYEVIMKANPQIKDPKQIRIGTRLKVPKL